MYHKATFNTRAYYDTIEEMPNKASVYYPDSTEPVMLSADEMLRLSDNGWHTIMHSCNYGVCDHWDAFPLSTWVRDNFQRIVTYVDKADKVVGYDRLEWSVKLTKNKSYHASEVWNS